jgi:glycosyltransferase involved in cell wall biosynthesis
MRIAQVIHTFPPYSVGGSENYTHALAKELQRLGHQVGVFHRIADSSRGEYAVEQAQVDGLPVWKVNHIFQYYDRFEKLYRDEEIDKRFGEFLDTFRPHIIHLHHLTCLSTAMVLEAKRRGCPVVMTLHDYWLICQRGQFLKPDLTLCAGQEDHECVKCLTRELGVTEANQKASPLDRPVVPTRFSLVHRAYSFLRKQYLLSRQWFWPPPDGAVQEVRRRMKHVRDICRNIDLFIAPSRFLQEKFLAFGVPSERLVFSDNGYDSASFREHQKACREEKRLRFGFIGVVFPPKGVHVLIEAFREVAEEEAELTIHGAEVPYEGFESYGEHLRRLAAGRKNIRFTGSYHPSEIGQLLGTVDVLVVPSVWYENSPLTIHEAFLARVPVITSDLGGMREFIRHGENGLLFRSRNVADLREKIRQFIRHPALVEQLGGRAPAVKTIGEDAVSMVKRYENLLALGNGNGSWRRAR